MKSWHATTLALLASALSGCLSYSSSSKTAAPPVDPGAPLCIYAGAMFSAGARVGAEEAPALECQADGSWRPI